MVNTRTSSSTLLFNVTETDSEGSIIEVNLPETTPKRFVDWKPLLLDTVGSTAWEPRESSITYRRQGEDSLNWGDVGSWIKYIWSKSLLTESSGKITYEQYHQFKKVLLSSGLYQLDRLYIVRQPDMVHSYLLEFPQLIETVFDGWHEINSIFGKDADVALEVVIDPESDNRKQLFIYIITALPVDDALERLSTIDELWFLNILKLVGGLLHINLELI